MMPGRTIKSIEAIDTLVRKKKCIEAYHGGWQRIPAAFVMNYPANTLLSMVKRGNIRTYKKDD